MDAESAGRSRTAEAQPGDRVRGAVLVVAALAVLTAGGAWWTTRAPATMAAGSGATDHRVALDGRDGSRVHVVDPVTGRVVAAGRSGLAPGARVERADGLPGAGVTVWSDRATITSRDGLVRRSVAEDGERYLLQFSCTGPGELLVVVDGARYAGPLTTGCGDAVTTATEVTGAGGPVQVSLSTVNGQPLRVEAQLLEFG